jgi:hypothetical protein
MGIEPRTYSILGVTLGVTLFQPLKYFICLQMVKSMIQSPSTLRRKFLYVEGCRIEARQGEDGLVAHRNGYGSASQPPLKFVQINFIKHFL